MPSGFLKVAALSSAFTLAACNVPGSATPGGRGAAYPQAPEDDASWVTPRGLERALQPPHDRTETYVHGRSIADPFRPLERTRTGETRAWVDRQNEKFEDYIDDSQVARDARAHAHDLGEGLVGVGELARGRLRHPHAHGQLLENGAQERGSIVPPGRHLVILPYADDGAPATSRSRAGMLRACETTARASP